MTSNEWPRLKKVVLPSSYLIIQFPSILFLESPRPINNFSIWIVNVFQKALERICYFLASQICLLCLSQSRPSKISLDHVFSLLVAYIQASNILVSVGKEVSCPIRHIQIQTRIRSSWKGSDDPCNMASNSNQPVRIKQKEKAVGFLDCQDVRNLALNNGEAVSGLN